MVTINILIYTDVKDISFDNDDGTKRATILKSLLETQTLAFVEFKVQLINRYDGFTDTETGTLHKLTDALLQPFDELWLFGVYQKNVTGKFTEDWGASDNELDQAELAVLEGWMAQGGLLIAGDHSAYQPGGLDTDPIDTFQCLGRALGHLVPRAGQLRLWDGPPTVHLDSSFNTLVGTVRNENDVENLQEDAVPQTIILEKFGPSQTPHRIFLGTNDTISILPDHGHEGGVIVPTTLGDKWPPFDEADDALKPRPQIVAFGCDKRSCDSRPVMAVYDGDQFAIGRIVADSSWHHYLNVNLLAFTKPEQAATLEIFSQLFHNIALYLAPLAKRQQMSREMIRWLLRHPEVKEERGNHPLKVGRVAFHYLSKKTTRCEALELLQVAGVTAGRPSERLHFAEISAGIALMPSRELVVGALLNSFYRASSEQLNEANSETARSETDIIKRGFQEAFAIHQDFLTKAASTFKDFEF